MNQEVLTLKSKTNLSCKICDRCCKYRGDIKLAPISVLEISKFLKISPKEFIEKYTHPVEAEAPEIAINAEGEERRCVLNNNENYRCKIHKVKPIQCVMFPLIPIDVEKDLFINMRTCPKENNKMTKVNKWLNGNHNIYKRNKDIYLKWVNFLEEIQPKWNEISEENQNKIKKILFEEYDLKKNLKNQVLESLMKAREIIYNK